MDKKLQVGVKAFLKNSDGKYLLLRRNSNKYSDVKDNWDIVGGRIDIGYPLIENLRREIQEETGLTMTSDPKLLHAQDIILKEKHVVRLTYVANTEGEVVLDESENDACEWLTLDEIKKKKGLDRFSEEVINLDLL